MIWRLTPHKTCLRMSDELLIVMPRAGRDSWGTLLPSRNNPEKQCCGSGTIYSGSGYRYAFGKISDPVPDPYPDNLIIVISFWDILFFMLCLWELLSCHICIPDPFPVPIRQMQCCGSGPGSGAFMIRNPGWENIQRQNPGYGMNVPNLIFENLVTVVWVKIPHHCWKILQYFHGPKELFLRRKRNFR